MNTINVDSIAGQLAYSESHWLFSCSDATRGRGEINFIIDEENRPLHISLRENHVVLNTQLNGVWATETKIDISDKLSLSYIKIDKEKLSYKLRIGEKQTFTVSIPEKFRMARTKMIWWSPGIKLLKPSRIGQSYVNIASVEKNKPEPALEKIHIVQTRVFGKSIRLNAPSSDQFIQASISRLERFYEPYLSSNLIDKKSTFIDIGAGYGSFSIPLAKALPRANFYCFEPLPKLFELLKSNIHENNLKNVLALNVGVVHHPEEKRSVKALTRKILTTSLGSVCSPQKFALSDVGDRGLERPDPARLSHGQILKLVHLPAIDSRGLRGLRPTIIKISAPGWERYILESLRDVPLEHVFGEIVDPIPSGIIYGSKTVSFSLPTIGGKVGLRRNDRRGCSRKPILDVVIPAYNAEKYIVECVEGVIGAQNSEIRAVIIDDGSKDRTLSVLNQNFGDNPNVSVICKKNGGCASARNFGRLNSSAEHIAFLDGDDVVDIEFFPSLLELARYTGAEVVQGEFDFFEVSDGRTVFSDSYEGRLFSDWGHVGFGDRSFVSIPGGELIKGQPTIWRRVYRRDFLDNKRVYFPEHIRAFDDLYFHILTLYYARTIPMIFGPRYHYRQHPAQDIKQGDERHFYELEMYRLILKRGLGDGWYDFDSILRSFFNTIKWSVGGLRDDLITQFLQGAADLWSIFEGCLGSDVFENWADPKSVHDDFELYLEKARDVRRRVGSSYAWVYTDSNLFHPGLVKALGQSAQFR